MVVKKANYGKFDHNGTFYGNASIDHACSIVTNCQVKSLCGGNRSCELTVDNNLLPSPYCTNTSNEIYTEYTCVDIMYTTHITGMYPNFIILMLKFYLIECCNQHLQMHHINILHSLPTILLDDF